MAETESEPALELPAPDAGPLWTRAFVQVCAGGFLSYASQSPITPIIALWVVHLGGSAATVGLVAAAFSAPSFILRPWVGKLCDSWSARGVFAVGCIISGLGSLIILIPTIGAVFISQVLNGVGWAGLNTRGYTIVADIAPQNRRGAAASYLQMSRTSLGFYLPYLALKAKAFAGFWVPFLATGIAGLLAAPTVIGVPERKRAKASSDANAEGFFDSLLDRESLLGTTILFFAMVTGPAINTFIVLYGEHIGVSEGRIAVLLLIRGAFGIVSQSMLAGLSDRVGRGSAVAIGLSTTAISMLFLSAAQGQWLLLLGMVLSTVSGSLTAPALQALAIDRSDPSKLGKAMATFSLAFQMGSFVGGILAGYLIDAMGYRGFYAVAAVPSCVAAALLFVNWRAITAPARALAAPEPAG